MATKVALLDLVNAAERLQAMLVQSSRLGEKGLEDSLRKSLDALLTAIRERG